MSRIVYVDMDECIGCGACVDECPEVFAMNDSLGVAMVLNPDGAEEAKIQEMIELCPVHCISWTGD